MELKVIATLYSEQRKWDNIGLFCLTLLDYLNDNNLPPSMATKRKEFEVLMPEFTSYIKKALSSGIKMKTIRNLVSNYTDVRLDEPMGGTRSFKDIHEYLIAKLGYFP